MAEYSLMPRIPLWRSTASYQMCQPLEVEKMSSRARKKLTVKQAAALTGAKRSNLMAAVSSTRATWFFGLRGRSNAKCLHRHHTDQRVRCLEIKIAQILRTKPSAKTTQAIQDPKNTKSATRPIGGFPVIA